MLLPQISKNGESIERNNRSNGTKTMLNDTMRNICRVFENQRVDGSKLDIIDKSLCRTVIEDNCYYGIDYVWYPHGEPWRCVATDGKCLCDSHKQDVGET